MHWWVGHFFGYGVILQIIALVHFIRRRPDGFWIWVIFLGGGLGAIIYLIAEALPAVASMQHSMHGFSRRKRIRILEAAVAENPSAGNYEELGELLLDEKEYMRARECFDRALGARSDSIDPFYKRGVCEFELGDFTAAVPDLQRVVAHDPKYAWSRARSLLARSLARLGRTSEAETAFQLLLEQSTSSESLCVAAQFFFEQQRFAEAHAIATRLLARRATMPAFQRRRDRVWLRGAAAVVRKTKNAGSSSS
jgi:hypothetical protein